jgi:hypothetical protein
VIPGLADSDSTCRLFGKLAGRGACSASESRWSSVKDVSEEMEGGIGPGDLKKFERRLKQGASCWRWKGIVKFLSNDCSKFGIKLGVSEGRTSERRAGSAVRYHTDRY